MKKLSLIGATLAMGVTGLVPATPAIAAVSSHGAYEAQDESNNYRGRRYHRGDRYEGRGYRHRGYRNNGYCRPKSGTTGTIIGAVAGGLLGREVTRDRYRGRSGTTGAIVGAGAGALLGRELTRKRC